MLAGDFFEVNGELKMCVADATITAGAATIQFVPELRATPADNTELEIDTPKGIFRLLSNEASWSNRSPVISSFTFDCVEDVIA
jgi:hypothetical protein